jgi:hypothetical protein
MFNARHCTPVSSIEHQKRGEEMFTAEYAIEVAGTEDAEEIDYVTASRIADNHGQSIEEYIEECDIDPNQIDAGDLFIWLGY